MAVRRHFVALVLVALAAGASGSVLAADNTTPQTPPATSIPLNPDDPTLEEWKHPRDMSADKRTPDPGTPEPGGLTARELVPLVRALCADQRVVGFDLVEFNPLADPGYTTGLNADRLIRQCLTGLAMRKRGLRGDYLSPLTAEDGRADPR
jgi:hypothetical protein